MMAIVSYAIGGIWLASLLAAIFARAKARRWPQLVVLATTLAFAAVWCAPLFLTAGKPASAKVQASQSTGSCASIEAGQAEEAVKTRLGAPTEVRGETELRGPGANVWIYRDSRCAVHVLNGVVESVD
jgi:hypothetical protein